MPLIIILALLLAGCTVHRFNTKQQQLQQQQDDCLKRGGNPEECRP